MTISNNTYAIRTVEFQIKNSDSTSTVHKPRCTSSSAKSLVPPQILQVDQSKLMYPVSDPAVAHDDLTSNLTSIAPVS